MTRYFFAGLIIVSLAIPAIAEENFKRSVKKGAEVTVNMHDAKTDTFLLTITGESAVGPNYAKSDEFRKAIAYEGSKEDFKKQRPQMSGSVYQLKKDLPLLELSEYATLVKKSKQQK